VTEGFDASRPNIARVYDYWLGGKDNFKADREQAEKLLRIHPGIADAVRANRHFVGRAVTWAAREGIGQFIDLGAGLPAPPSVHETARAVLPGARVAYIDNDPVVIAYARALLATGGEVAAIPGDLRDPVAVLASEALTEVIDLRRPVCAILALVLHFSDAAAAREITAGYISALAPGSCIVLSVGGSDDPGGRVATAYTASTLYTHSREQVAGFLAGLDLIEPGLSDARAWRPGWWEKPRPQAGYVLAAVGRKPVPRACTAAATTASEPGLSGSSPHEPPGVPVPGRDYRLAADQPAGTR
jgi:O-methyltransferase involved in polyketide biosynthesis